MYDVQKLKNMMSAVQNSNDINKKNSIKEKITHKNKTMLQSIEKTTKNK